MAKKVVAKEPVPSDSSSESYVSSTNYNSETDNLTESQNSEASLSEEELSSFVEGEDLEYNVHEEDEDLERTHKKGDKVAEGKAVKKVKLMDKNLDGPSDRAASRRSAKELTQDRKKQKSGGDLVLKIKEIWERGRRAVSEGNKKESGRIVGELMTLVRGHTKELLFKHDASRVIQFCIKEGKESHRLELLEELKGSFMELTCSKYGRFVLMKFLKYLSPSRSCIREELVKSTEANSLKKIALHREGANVLEELFLQFSNAAQKQEMLENLYGPEYRLLKKDGLLPKSIQNHIVDMSQASINKGTFGFCSLLHFALLEVVKNASMQKGETVASIIYTIIEMLKDQFIHILHLKYGSLLVRSLLPYTNIKIRKAFIKECKPVILKIASDEYGHLVLLSLLDLTDDTVLTGKYIISSLTEDLQSLLAVESSPPGKKLISFFLFHGFSSKIFNAEIIQYFDDGYAKSQSLGNTKKSRPTRHQEMLALLQPALITYLSTAILRNNSELLKMLGDSLSHILLCESLFLTPVNDTNTFPVMITALTMIKAISDDDALLLIHEKNVSKFILSNLSRSDSEKRTLFAVSCWTIFGSSTNSLLRHCLSTADVCSRFGIKIVAYILRFGIDSDSSRKKGITELFGNKPTPKHVQIALDQLSSKRSTTSAAKKESSLLNNSDPVFFDFVTFFKSLL